MNRLAAAIPAHDRARKIGVLLVNLGTPEAPTPAAVRSYLAQFLSDPRVIEIPRVVWKPFLHGFLLRTRAPQSARRYASIWTPEGSPLLVHSTRQATLLRGYLGERLKRAGLPSDFAQVELGMRYGAPSVASALDKLRAAGVERVLAIPLYPQYAASSTGSAIDAVFDAVRALRRVPALRVVDSFHDDRGYIAALARSINDYWTIHGRPDKLVLSFHGVPRRTLDLGDPYYCFCQKTARLVAAELGLDQSTCIVAFQSRFGRARWLEPYTAPTLRALAESGAARIDVACPGFVADCLETLEEIAQEAKSEFLRAGGREFHAIPCLNEHPAWIHALAALAHRHLEGWLDPPPDAAERQRTRERAVALGAPS